MRKIPPSEKIRKRMYRSITFWKNFLFPKDILKEEGKRGKHVVFEYYKR